MRSLWPFLFLAACATASSEEHDAGTSVATDARSSADARRASDASSIDAGTGGDDAALRDGAVADATPVADAVQSADSTPPADAAAPPDAAPPADSGTCMNPMWVELLSNPGLETNLNWIEQSSSGFPIIQSSGALPVAPQEGMYAAWFGGTEDEDATLRQDVAVPAGATALRLTGQRYIGTEDFGDFDSLDFELRTTAGALIERLGGYLGDETDYAWKPFTFETMTPPAGQTVRFVIHGITDSFDSADFVVDDLSLEALLCDMVIE